MGYEWSLQELACQRRGQHALHWCRQIRRLRGQARSYRFQCPYSRSSWR